MTRPGDDSCPVCGATSGVQQLNGSPQVQAWRCTACSTGWACTRVGPPPQQYLDQLTATVKHLALLRQIVHLADEMPKLTDPELRARLTALAATVQPVSRSWALSPADSHVHLLTPGQHPTDGLAARCGALLPAHAIQHDQPPPGPPCEPCRVILLADFADAAH
ncbi:MAG: hypothetical protein ACRDSN_19735 [Pseudonocardiaceae bacterium]